MTPEQIKIIKKLVGEGYKLKVQHSNPEWRKALEDAEGLLIDLKVETKDVTSNSLNSNENIQE